MLDLIRFHAITLNVILFTYMNLKLAILLSVPYKLISTLPAASQSTVHCQTRFSVAALASGSLSRQRQLFLPRSPDNP